MKYKLSSQSRVWQNPLFTSKFVLFGTYCSPSPSNELTTGCLPFSIWMVALGLSKMFGLKCMKDWTWIFMRHCILLLSNGSSDSRRTYNQTSKTLRTLCVVMADVWVMNKHNVCYRIVHMMSEQLLVYDWSVHGRESKKEKKWKIRAARREGWKKLKNETKTRYVKKVCCSL